MAEFVNFYLIPGLVLGSIYALGAIGITLTFGILRFANFSHGETMTLGVYFAWTLVQLTKLHPLVVMPVAMVLTVVVVLAILAGVALPKYFDYAADAREASCKGVLGGVRAGVANFYANSAINGTPAYPTLTELNTVGTVMQEPIPVNPYNDSATVVASRDTSWRRLRYEE